MKQPSDKRFSDTWFFKWVLNNQAVVAIFITLLVGLMGLVLVKISPLFAPIWDFIGIIMLPIVISALLYYLLEPLVDWLEKKGIGRTIAIVLVFIAIVSLLVWAVANVIPMITHQLMTFMDDLPTYIQTVNKEINRFLEHPFLKNYQGQLQDTISNINTKAVDYAESISKNALSWASRFASAFARVTVAIIIAPFILFYLLRDGHTMKDGILKVLPTRVRSSFSHILSDVNSQLAGYVQGQVVVAIVVSIMFGVMYSIVGLRYGVTLGIIAGILNMVPYLGSFLAQVPVFILAIVAGPIMVVKVAIVFVIEQTIEGRFVSPLVLGTKLNIHPITIMLILLTAGSMFGIWGVFLGIPIYASIKVIIKEVFDWYKSISGLYEEERTIDERRDSTHAK
ncbi:AI-2E family transporter [Streptococcus sciuri]|uniref:AI-2E family transporter n=1 Tax=Streptococcus sciuri TaxID=2973939 RepID=A0ABT2F5I6_9STRE|nr:AI-2E family transporter [Streptococcus sciuri]MCS4487741.1 AI-2E family transporter [Streptococcus sciuri]